MQLLAVVYHRTPDRAGAQPLALSGQSCDRRTMSTSTYCHSDSQGPLGDAEGGSVEALWGQSANDSLLVESSQLDRDLQAGAARYLARPSAGHKLDPRKGIIRNYLEELPKLSAQCVQGLWR